MEAKLHLLGGSAVQTRLVAKLVNVKLAMARFTIVKVKIAASVPTTIVESPIQILQEVLLGFDLDNFAHR